MRTRRDPTPRSIWDTRFGYLFPALCVGCLILFAGLIIVAGLMLLADGSERVLSILAGLVLAASGYGMGYFAGFHRRRQGLRTGLYCGLLLAVILWIFGMAWQQIGGGILRPVCLCLFSMWGGIAGVNRKHNRPPR